MCSCIVLFHILKLHFFIMKHIKGLQKQLSEIESHIAKGTTENKTVSKSNIAWHLDHSLKVINSVTGLLQQSDPDDYKSNFSTLRLYCFIFNYIPRGKGKSPKAVLPPDIITEEDLKKQTNYAKSELQHITDLPKTSNFKHPYFGQLNKQQTLRFLKLHTEHHLKIVRDILNVRNTQ